MCVLTYIPTENNGFILTSNRDESVIREAAIPPKKYNVHGQTVFLPKDPKGGGTWIGSCGSFTLCLLNGGYQKHIPKPPYRQSRGKVVLDFYRYYNLNDFINNYSFEGIEPFTLIVINSIGNLIMNEIRWDGTRVYNKKLNTSEPQIWSSVTLYSPEVIQERERWFQDFLIQDINRDTILDFHHFGGGADTRNSIKMNRDNQLKTISITQYVINHSEFVISYHDLQADNKFQYRIFRELVE